MLSPMQFTSGHRMPRSLSSVLFRYAKLSNTAFGLTEVDLLHCRQCRTLGAHAGDVDFRTPQRSQV
eukprot:5702799-Alexandrium_andersonii.AAC.1